VSELLYAYGIVPAADADALAGVVGIGGAAGGAGTIA